MKKTVLLHAFPSPRYIRAGIGPDRAGKPIELRQVDPPWNPRPYLGHDVPITPERAHRLAPSVTAGGTPPAGPQSRSRDG